MRKPHPWGHYFHLMIFRWKACNCSWAALRETEKGRSQASASRVGTGGGSQCRLGSPDSSVPGPPGEGQVQASGAGAMDREGPVSLAWDRGEGQTGVLTPGLISSSAHRGMRDPPLSPHPQLPGGTPYFLKGSGWGPNSAFRLPGFKSWLSHPSCESSKHLSWPWS